MSTNHAATAWRDRHGDVWKLGSDGMLWTPETAPFPREHVEKKWGPLVPEPVDPSPTAPESPTDQAGTTGTENHTDGSE